MVGISGGIPNASGCHRTRPWTGTEIHLDGWAVAYCPYIHSKASEYCGFSSSPAPALQKDVRFCPCVRELRWRSPSGLGGCSQPLPGHANVPAHGACGTDAAGHAQDDAGVGTPRKLRPALQTGSKTDFLFFSHSFILDLSLDTGMNIFQFAQGKRIRSLSFSFSSPVPGCVCFLRYEPVIGILGGFCSHCGIFFSVGCVFQTWHHRFDIPTNRKSIRVCSDDESQQPISKGSLSLKPSSPSRLGVICRWRSHAHLPSRSWQTTRCTK